MTAHTPGPWRYVADFAEIQGEGGETLIAYPATSTSSRFNNASLGVPDWDEMEANALLMAEAPHLLELVKRLHHLVKICDAAVAIGYEAEFLEAEGTYWMASAEATIAAIEERES